MKRRASPVLLFMWGVMGTVLAWMLLWMLLSAGGSSVDAAWRWNRHLLQLLGLSWSDATEIAILHLQFAGLGFAAGVGFRLLGVWREDHPP